MPLSSDRSTTIPLSFDRFRVKSIQFLSPFRHHHCDRRLKQSPERSWVRKTQVHPNDVKLSESAQIDYNSAAYLFHANKHLNSNKSSLSKNSQNKKYSNNFLKTRSTSNFAGLLDVYKSPVINASRPSKSDIMGYICPPTPCMIDYQHGSLPNLLPTRVIKRPKSFDRSIKQSDFDQLDAS